MKLHSAGHIVDFALYLLGYSPNPLMPLKGDHGKKPVICYLGSVADGGTQVRNSSEIGKISILPIEQKDGMTLIHYRLA